MCLSLSLISVYSCRAGRSDGSFFSLSHSLSGEGQLVKCSSGVSRLMEAPINAPDKDMAGYEERKASHSPLSVSAP